MLIWKNTAKKGGKEAYWRVSCLMRMDWETPAWLFLFWSSFVWLIILTCLNRREERVGLLPYTFGGKRSLSTAAFSRRSCRITCLSQNVTQYLIPRFSLHTKTWVTKEREGTAASFQQTPFPGDSHTPALVFQEMPAGQQYFINCSPVC